MGDFSSVLSLYIATGKPMIASEENTDNLYYFVGSNFKFSANDTEDFLKENIHKEMLDWVPAYKLCDFGSGKRIYEQIIANSK